MRKYLDRTTVVAIAGFAAGYFVGRNYDVTLGLKKKVG